MSSHPFNEESVAKNVFSGFFNNVFSLFGIQKLLNVETARDRLKTLFASYDLEEQFWKKFQTKFRTVMVDKKIGVEANIRVSFALDRKLSERDTVAVGQLYCFIIHNPAYVGDARTGEATIDLAAVENDHSSTIGELLFEMDFEITLPPNQVVINVIN